MDRERIRALQATAMFGALREDALAWLLERAKPRSVARGASFFEQGDRGGSAFLLERGRVSVVKLWEGREHLLRRLSAGDCFGEVALLDFGPRSASVRADEDAAALEFGARDLRELARFDPEQFALVYMNLGRELSRRLRDADERLFRASVSAAAGERAGSGPAVGYVFVAS